MGRIIPYILWKNMENIKCLKPPTRSTRYRIITASLSVCPAILLYFPTPGELNPLVRGSDLESGGVGSSWVSTIEIKIHFHGESLEFSGILLVYDGSPTALPISFHSDCIQYLFKRHGRRQNRQPGGVDHAA